MATEMDWTTTDTPTGQSSVRVFADGDGDDWCVHKVPGYIKAISIKNTGSGSLYLSWGPALRGAADPSTQHCWPLETGEDRLISFAGASPDRPPREVSTHGDDGASHTMALVFESEP